MNSEIPEWTPEYLQTARTAADRAVPERATEGADAIALAIRELAAEVRALRYQLAGGRPPGRRGGALEEIERSIDLLANAIPG